MANSVEVIGLRELTKTFINLGIQPRKVLPGAVRSAAKIQQRSAKIKAPKDTGLLQRGIVIRSERSRSKFKKVYQVTMDKKYTDFYRRLSKNSYLRVRFRKRKLKISFEKKVYYYPASQEYGFKARNGRYIPGYRYLKKSADENDSLIKSTIVNDLAKRIDVAMKG